MGIDKPDVRFVLACMDYPRIPESYYQEIGRSVVAMGTSQQTVYCYSATDDVDTIHHFIDQGASISNEKEQNRSDCKIFVDWATSLRSAVEKRLISDYFGEQGMKTQNCGTCDNCRKT